MPSLTEARKAALQLIAMYDHIHNRDQLPNYNAIKTIAAYLDKQVNLNVEKFAAMDRVGEVDMTELKREITQPTVIVSGRRFKGINSGVDGSIQCKLCGWYGAGHRIGCPHA